MPAHELRQRAEIAVGARDLIGRQHITAARLQHAHVAQVAAHRGLRDRVAGFLQQAHELALPAHLPFAQDLRDGLASLLLLAVEGHRMNPEGCIKLRASCILMQMESSSQARLGPLVSEGSDPIAGRQPELGFTAAFAA